MMNLLSSSLFVCTAAIIYRRRRTMSGAVLGLVCGVAALVAGMLLWNWLVTPWYMNVPRNVVEGMLLPVILPFNLLKGGINAALTLLLYRPLTGALRGARLLPPATTAKARSTTLAVVLIAGFLLTTLVLAFLAWGGIL
jgi:riboflavin transporter FmnP